MRSRLAGVLALWIVAALGGAGDAAAAWGCSGSSSATTGLTLSGDTFHFHGTLRCDGGSISRVRLYRPETGETVAQTEGTTCETCSEPVTSAGTAPADPLKPGHYIVYMDFHVPSCGSYCGGPDWTVNSRWFWYGPLGLSSCKSPLAGTPAGNVPRCFL